MIILKKIKNLWLLTKQTSCIRFELMKNYHFLIKNTTFPIEPTFPLISYKTWLEPGVKQKTPTQLNV